MHQLAIELHVLIEKMHLVNVLVFLGRVLLGGQIMLILILHLDRRCIVRLQKSREVRSRFGRWW